MKHWKLWTLHKTNYTPYGKFESSMLSEFAYGKVRYIDFITYSYSTPLSSLMKLFRYFSRSAIIQKLRFVKYFCNPMGDINTIFFLNWERYLPITIILGNKAYQDFDSQTPGKTFVLSPKKSFIIFKKFIFSQTSNGHKMVVVTYTYIY